MKILYKVQPKKKQNNNNNNNKQKKKIQNKKKKRFNKAHLWAVSCCLAIWQFRS